ncbi:minor tail protein [Gordonia phage Guey18]|nr:minor tail protein [Gordonia phage Guey18]
MFEPSNSIIELFGCDGSYFVIHGQGAGDQGVYLGKGQAEGLYDAPVKTQWRSSAHEIGGKHKKTSYLIRELELGFHILGTDVEAAQNESDLRKAFDYSEDPWDDDAVQAKLTWTIETADNSSSRSLDVLLSDTPEMKMEVDPRTLDETGYFNLVLPLSAGQPMWYEPSVTTVFSSTATSASGTITVSNPTDRPMAHKFICTRATWVLPDPSWRGKRYLRAPGGPYPSRTVTLPALTSTDGGAVVDLDPMQLNVRSANGTNLLGRMPVVGSYFMHVIPPYTPPTQLPVSYTGAPAGGAMVQCVQPRLWSRPWGLE